MKKQLYRFLLPAGLLVSGAVLAQPAVQKEKTSFKELHQRQFSDKFTGREIKKKELRLVAPSQLNFIIAPGDADIKKQTLKKKDALR